MRHIFFVFLLILISLKSLSQVKVLDKEKYSDCRLIIPIDYKNLDKDYEEAGRYLNTVILIIYVSGNDKIKRWERGYIRRREKDGIKSVYFEPMESVVSPHQKIAEFPLFNKRNTYCYNAECYDGVQKK